MESVVWSVRRSVSDFHLMNVCVVRPRNEERKNALESHLFLIVFCSFVSIPSSSFRPPISELASIMFKMLDLEISLLELLFELHLCRLSG